MNVRGRATGYVEVNLGALIRNYQKIGATCPSVNVGAVVKANAYGLGAQPVAAALATAGCDRFFVATLEEGITLREGLPDGSRHAQIFVFEGARLGSEQSYSRHGLQPVLNTREQIEAWCTVGGPCAVHVDSGMNRLGLGIEECAEIFADAQLPERLGLRHVMTHLACADDPQDVHNRRQLDAFSSTLAVFGEAVEISIANSAGAFLDAAFHADVVRAGIALYGGNPFAEQANPMEPVVTLYARVLQVRELTQPATVGYGATFEAAAGTRIATVGVGYADGYPRCLGNVAQAAFDGARVPVVGRVSMDLTGIDVTVLGDAAPVPGDYVEMFGSTVSVDEVAAASGTISYEVLTGLNARLPRVYVE